MTVKAVWHIVKESGRVAHPSRRQATAFLLTTPKAGAALFAVFRRVRVEKVGSYNPGPCCTSLDIRCAVITGKAIFISSPLVATDGGHFLQRLVLAMCFYKCWSRCGEDIVLM
jgi:hypothetical protein